VILVNCKNWLKTEIIWE